MIVRPRKADFKIIGLYSGKIIIGVGCLMIIPILVSLIFKEWNSAIDFFVGFSVCLVTGLLLEVTCQTTQDLTWSNGLVVVGFSWILATAFGAIPHWLSGHFGSYLDAMFDVMSGYTTTGLYLLQDLDHISNGLNMWRHLLSYAGGQGIIVIALTFLIGGTAGAYKLYVGEGKEERLLPNVIQTARAIWLISLLYLVAGTISLWLAGLTVGQTPVRAFLHSLWVFMGSWSTGGFAPQSFNILYYHSVAYEVIVAVIFIIGSFNFALHWAVWTGKKSEIRKNIEIISFFVTMTVIMMIATAGLTRLGIYPDVATLFRKMFFHIASGHTTTGYSTVYSRTFVVQWGPLAMMAIIIAMAIGASACSTAGGIKGLRVGLIFTAVRQAVRRMISPEKAYVVNKWHHITTRVLDDRVVYSSMMIVIFYIITFLIGTLAGIFYGYEPLQALFDAVSAGSNTGLSCGVTSPSMPVLMKIVYIIEMWAGRLEFMGIFALGGYILSLFRGK